MPNLFLTPSVIAREALVLLQSNLVTQRLFSRRYESQLNAGSKVGETISIRRRSRGTVDEYNGSSVTVRDIEESSIPLTLERHFDATIRITDRERTMSLVDFSEQVLAPRMIEMGEKIDAYGLTKLAHLPNVAGPHEFGLVGAGSGALALPTTIGDWALCDKTLNDLKVPLNPRVGIVSTTQKATILSQEAFVNVDKSGDDSALRAARVGPIMNFDLYMGQNVNTATFTSGTLSGAVVVGSPVIGATTIGYGSGVGGTGGTLRVGDIVRIFFAGSTNDFQDCVVRGPLGSGVIGALAVTSTGSTGTFAGSFSIWEPIRHPITAGATISVYRGGGTGKDRQNHGAIFHPDAFAFVAVPLDLPVGTPAAYISDPSSNLSMRAVFDYDRNLKSDVLSLDILCGAAMVDGRLGAQLVRQIS
jgi:hypothetical protein